MELADIRRGREDRVLLKLYFEICKLSQFIMFSLVGWYFNFDSILTGVRIS